MNQNEYKSEDLIKLSEAGDVDAQSRLGTNYLIGRDNFPVDYEEGVKWLEKAAESGHSGAQTNLAYCYENGMGVPRDRGIAVKWLEKASSQGVPEAIAGLSDFYLRGLGVAKDLERGFELCKQAAEKDFPEAQFRLGQLYHEGIGCKEDHTKALEWLEKASEQGHSKATTMAGYMNIRYWGANRKNVEKAIELFSKTAADGDAVAQTHLGEIFFKQGKVDEAEKMFRAAAENGDPQSLLYLGLFYNMGLVVPKNHDLAAAYFRKSFAVRRIPIDDDQVEKDLKDASYELFTKLGNAAYFGDRSIGDFTEQNYDNALRYFNGALELVEDDKENASMKVNALIRIAKVYRQKGYMGLSRLLFSRAKWVSLQKGDTSLYIKVVVYELKTLMSLDLVDDARKLLDSTLEHFDATEYGAYRMSMTKHLFE